MFKDWNQNKIKIKLICESVSCIVTPYLKRSNAVLTAYLKRRSKHFREIGGNLETGCVEANDVVLPGFSFASSFGKPL